MTPPQDDLLGPGMYLGRYQLVRLLAQGGMADVYLARSVSTSRLAAVKVLNARRAADPESHALFHDEARLVGKLDHLNLAGILEVDVETGVHYLVMEYVHGADLREILRHATSTGRAVPYGCALTIVSAAAAGLHHAHTRCGDDGRPLQLVHRDVSLSNIMVGHDGSVKVIDFGIAQSSQAIHETNPGVVRGKAAYMSPEQCLGDPVDLRTDVFALGVVLYELTTGRRCIVGETDFERMLAVVRGEWTPPMVHHPQFPLALERVIRIALALDPAHRYPSMVAMIEDLEEVAALEGWTLGSRTTARFMAELFGRISFPSLEDDDDPATVVGPLELDVNRMVVEDEPSHVTRVIMNRRIAHDNTPTRGRRSAPRLWNPVAA